MLKQIANTSLLLGRIVQPCNFLSPVVTPSIQQRFIKKHWNPKFKTLRRQKVIKMTLPNYQEKTDDLTEEEMRARLKEKGLLPPRPWEEVPFFLACTGSVFEPYVPPEGDGKFSAITTTGAKQKVEFLKKKGKSMMAVRKIKSYDETFTTSDFPAVAHDIYVKAHEELTKKTQKIIEYVTEKAYSAMTHNIKNKQIVWKFVKSLEPCRIVHARCTKVNQEDDIYAQVTCRFHTQQILAVYDRFGRLMHGSDHLVKDVLEYIVFERHLANEYGTWRIHDKIVPSWMPPKEPVPKSYVRSVKKEEPPPPVDQEELLRVRSKWENPPTPPTATQSS